MKTTLLALMTYCVLLQTADHRAWIDRNIQDGQMQIQGKFLNQRSEADTFRYELTTVKHGKAGRSQSSQGGQFVAPANEEIVLTQTTVSIQAEDTYTIELKIFRSDSVYLQDQIVH